MTKVIDRYRRRHVLAIATLLLGTPLLVLGANQNGSQSGPDSSIHIVGKSAPIQLAPAESLYLQLRGVGLDKARVYRIRDITLDRSSFHLTLDDGTIAFTEDVNGHVTGAFFEGEGEILLAPPNRMERASLALFTNEAILEESFATAYLRFNDNTFSELQPYLKPVDDAPDFVSKWNDLALKLAEPDALRLLLTFSRSLPVAGQKESLESPISEASSDQFLHARIQGRKLGTFDVYFDATASEELWAGQLRTSQGANYYDLWTSFTAGRPADTKTKRVGGTRSTGTDFVKVSDYKIRVRITPPTRIEAETNLHLQVQKGGQRTVLFELSRSLQVTSVEANGQAVEYIHNPAIEGTQLARRGNDLVAVVFSKPITTGETIDLKFQYAGDVLSEAGPGLLYVGARGTWYPNRGLVMANFDLQFEYPQGWTLVATGSRVDVTPIQDQHESGPSGLRAGDQLRRWIGDRSIPVAGFNLGKYQRGVAQAGNVEVEAFATSTVERGFPTGPEDVVVPSGTGGLAQRPVSRPPEPSPARNAQSVAETSASAITFFSHHFGPYPFSKLALTQMPGAESQGWPGLIFLSSYSFLSREEIARLRIPEVDRAIIRQVIAHETAHQWWGDLVGWAGYRDQWWVEALANYSSLMQLESKDPAEFHAIMESYRDGLLEKNENERPLTEDGPVALGTRLSNSVFPGGYVAISYGRGTWLFHMLRHMLLDAENGSAGKSAAPRKNSEEPFLRALRRLRERYEGKAVTTAEVLSVFEEELPTALKYEGRDSLDWFDEGWVGGTAIPRYELKQVKFADEQRSTVVSGSILQREAPEDLVTSVPLYASLLKKNVLLGRIFADGAETHFRLFAPLGTRKVVIDPYGTILSRPR